MSDMIKFRIEFEGIEPLIMHNGRLSNPLDPMARALKEMTGKRKKTDEDHLKIAELEFRGGLYHDAELGPYIPSDNVWRCLFDGGKKFKLGTAVKEGVIVTTPVNPLVYSGPRTVEKLWADEAFRHYASAKVGMQRVNRTRPIFHGWKVDAESILDPSVLNLDQLRQIADTAGRIIGLGEWRPRFGTFRATVSEL